MRRRCLSLLLAVGLVLALPPVGASADPAGGTAVQTGEQPGEQTGEGDEGSAGTSTDPVEDVDPEEAQEALDTAERVLEGDAQRQDPSPTVALSQLSASLGTLRGRERRQARAMLARPDQPAARPTDGRRDRFGDGYTRRAFKRCTRHFCLHFTKAGPDRRPGPRWVTRNLRVLEAVWHHHIGRLGYRRPLPDRGRGGSNKFDVYLKNVGAQGYYGYCAPERRPNPRRRLESGYCVLDNNFTDAGFGPSPVKNLRVTAAHEFFHAIQYNYDVREDPWLMEATATWIEERFADGINDNRQFLPAGQVARPGRPLDASAYGSLAPYGNWAFFEYLSRHFGAGIVRQVWNRAGDFAGAPDQASVRAVQTALRSRKHFFAGTFARFAAANTIPAASYPEGRAWPRAPISQRYRLRPGHRSTGTVTNRLDHLTSRNVAITRTRRGFAGGRTLVLRVNAPRRAFGAAVHAIVHRRNGTRTRRLLRLNRRGDTTARLPFHRGVGRVTLTLANGSGRYRCWRGRSWSCQGIPRDDHRAFRFVATAVRHR